MATINPESVNPDNALTESFPYILRIDPLEKSFYTSLAFSVLFKLACVSKQMKKEVIHKLREYLAYELKPPNIEKELNIPESLSEGIRNFPEILYLIESQSLPLRDIEASLKQNASSISAAFQVILASIFARSHKIPEAEDILNGKKVLCQNTYYFENFAKSLALRLVIHVPGENVIEKMDDKVADRVNVELFVVNKQSSEFAVMRHRKEIELISTLNSSLVNDLPFVFIRKKTFAPVGVGNYEGHANSDGFKLPGQQGLPPNLPGQGLPPNLPAQGFGNPGMPGPPPGLPPTLPGQVVGLPGMPGPSPGLPPTLPGQGYGNPGMPGPSYTPGTQYNNSLPNFPSVPQVNTPVPNLPNAPGPNPYHSQVPQNNPMQDFNSYQNPKPSNPLPKTAYIGDESQLEQESMFINSLIPLLISNSTMLTKSEFRSLKKILKNLRSQNKSLMTEGIRSIKEISEGYCKKDHDPTNFVIFRSCGKRHCKMCLNDGDDRVICDCRKEISGEDLSYILGRSIKCIICKRNIDDPSQKVGTTHFMHRDCYMKLS